MKQLADIPIGNGGLKGLGNSSSPLNNISGTPITNLTTFISMVVGVITIIGIIWFIFIFFTGIIGVISSEGDKNKVETSKKKITSGLIGLVVVIVSVFILDLVGFILGFNAGTGGLLDIPALFGLIK
jgi:hypothetical protein